ncbi:hypothetical protein NUV62_04980 [Acinetobacter venetianus]|nr:hypothetical protein [Acinetobacter venetianus]
MNFKIWLLLISIPLACEVSIGFIGLFGLLLTNIVYFPISWIGEPFSTATVRLVVCLRNMDVF